MASGGKDTITISVLEEQYHLSQGYLERRCTDDHALQIATRLNSWERLASRLGLTQQHIEAIKRDNDSEDGKREATLRKWKEVFAFRATYRKLIVALLGIDRADLASDICELITPKQEQSPSRPPSQQKLESTQQEQLSADQFHCPSPSSPQTSLEPTSPQSSSGISVASPPLQLTFPTSHPTAKSPVVKQLELKFSEVVLKVIELYTQSDGSLQKLKRITNNLSPDIKGELGPFFRKERSQISKAKSIDDLFAILSDFYDYLQPDLLVYLVEQCDNNEAKMVVSKYEEELGKCRQKISLQEYIGKRLCNLNDKDRYQIAIRLGNEWHEKTLDDLERMRFAFADEFSLLRLVPKLHGLKLGSITIIFSLPKSVVLNHDQLFKFFQAYNPLQVMVDGVFIYDVESIENLITDDITEKTKEERLSEDHRFIAEEREKLREQLHPPASSDMKQEVTNWKATVEGQQHHAAYGTRDVLFIASSERLQGPDIVPRRDVELTKDDSEKLKRLNLSPEQWKDDTNIMVARFQMDKDCTVVGVERSTPEHGLTREYVLKRIERLLTSTRKQGVGILHFGPGKRNTGDWCFEDGYITFRDLAQLYCNCFKGRVLTIHTDCSYSGCWVKELIKFLGEQGVRPCGHSAREKGILIKVFASCQPTEIPYRLLYSVRTSHTDKNTGASLTKPSGFKVANEQHVYWLDPTQLSCSASSFEEPCTFTLEYTWERREAGKQGRICLLIGEDHGRPAWFYLLLDDDEAKIKEYKELTQGENAGKYTVVGAKYGKVIKSGWGKDPSDDVKEWMKNNYGYSA